MNGDGDAGYSHAPGTPYDREAELLKVLQAINNNLAALRPFVDRIEAKLDRLIAATERPQR